MKIVPFLVNQDSGKDSGITALEVEFGQIWILTAVKIKDAHIIYNKSMPIINLVICFSKGGRL